MQIKVTTDNHVAGSDRLNKHVQSVLEDALGRFGNRVTWVEVHFGDQNSYKTGGAYCGVHAKLAGAETFNVIAESETIDQGLDLAIDKLLKVIDRTLGKREDARKHSRTNGEPGL